MLRLASTPPIAVVLVLAVLVSSNAPAAFQARSQETLATQLVAAIHDADVKQFAALLPSYDEFSTWAERELTAEDRADLGREWYTEHFEYL